MCQLDPFDAVVPDLIFRTPLLAAKERQLGDIQVDGPEPVPWDGFSSASPPSNVEGAARVEFRLDCEDSAQPPPWLSTLETVRLLTVPDFWLRSGNSFPMPPNLEGLRVKTCKNSKIRLDVPHRRLSWIEATGVRGWVNANAFPQLKGLHVKLESKCYGFLAGLRNLVSISVTPCSTDFDFGQIPEGIEDLRLIGGTFSDLTLLSRFRQLRELYLHSLPKMRAVRPIVMLEQVEVLFLLYCKGVTDLGLLAGHRSLKRLGVFGCGVGKERGTRDALQKRFKVESFT